MADFTVPASLKATAANAVTRNAAIAGKMVAYQVAMLEFDLTGGTIALASYVDLIPAALNKNGLIVIGLKSFVTEILAADATSGVVTVRDGASSPNTLGTFTAVDADDVGELVAISSYTEWESLVDNTDYSAQHVEVGVKVEAAVTTLATDAGTATGKILVLIEFVAIPEA